MRTIDADKVTKEEESRLMIIATNIPERGQKITNGDVIKAMFPQMNINEDWKATRHGDIVISGVTEVAISATTDWWNAPYKGV